MFVCSDIDILASEPRHNEHYIGAVIAQSQQQY